MKTYISIFSSSIFYCWGVVRAECDIYESWNILNWSSMYHLRFELCVWNKIDSGTASLLSLSLSLSPLKKKRTECLYRGKGNSRENLTWVLATLGAQLQSRADTTYVRSSRQRSQHRPIIAHRGGVACVSKRRFPAGLERSVSIGRPSGAAMWPPTVARAKQERGTIARTTHREADRVVLARCECWHERGASEKKGGRPERADVTERTAGLAAGTVATDASFIAHRRDGLGADDDGEPASHRDRASLLRRHIHLLLRERRQRERARHQSRRAVALG